MKKIISILLGLCLATTLYASSNPAITLFKNKFGNGGLSLDKITAIVQSQFDSKAYRDIKVQVILNNKHIPDHLLVFLLSKEYHGFKLVRINLDYQSNVLSVQKNYHVTAEDNAQQPGVALRDLTCPDPDAQFIGFAPNNDDLEQKITVNVINAAKFHQLKTISLLKEDATRENYLNYMSCPKLIGNFYDGDADPEMILVVDGFIYADDIKKILANKFRFKVTNIWLACEAFNDPMKSAVIDVAQTQKYAAGINDLLVGPSDRAAACAMKKAMNHLPMKEAFDDCYKKLDTPADHWGYDGQGSNYFGV